MGGVRQTNVLLARISSPWLCRQHCRFHAKESEISAQSKTGISGIVKSWECRLQLGPVDCDSSRIL